MQTRKTHTSHSASIFQDLRDGFAFVAENAQHVTINTSKTKDYARILDALPAPDTLDEENHFVSGDLEQDFAYILILDSINFGSGYKPALRAEGMDMIEGSFYFTIAQRLKKHFETAPISASQAAKIHVEQVREIFEFPAQNAVKFAQELTREATVKSTARSDELSALFTDAINELGQHIIDTADGSFTQFVSNMNSSAAQCVGSLSQLDMFKDTASYRGRNIAFYKRAQITATDLHLIAGKNGTELFNDISECTIFCDNAVPRVLKADGILEYTPALTKIIEDQEQIPFGSDMEVEIRGCAAHAVELIARFSKHRVIDLDHRLWHRSKEPQTRTIPSHKTRTIFY